MMDDHQALRIKLQDIFLLARSSMNTHFSHQLLSEIGVDASRFNLAEETLLGGKYFRPMSQKTLSTLSKRMEMSETGFWPDRGFPCTGDAYMVQDILTEQITSSKDDDGWKALDSTLWTYNW
jgi:hypothetical protein